MLSFFLLFSLLHLITPPSLPSSFVCNTHSIYLDTIPSYISSDIPNRRDFTAMLNHETRATVPQSRIHPRTRLVVGAVIGSVVAPVLIIVMFLLWRQYRRVRPSAQGPETVNAPGNSLEVPGPVDVEKGNGSVEQSARPSSGMCAIISRLT